MNLEHTGRQPHSFGSKFFISGDIFGSKVNARSFSLFWVGYKREKSELKECSKNYRKIETFFHIFMQYAWLILLDFNVNNL